MRGGNWGKILKVNLSTGEFEDVEVQENLYRDYLGGSGLAAKWFFDNKLWEADPLSPENHLMVMMGPLSGTGLPGTARLEVCARSPLTGIWGESCMGGHFTPQLKATGYDGIVFTGASDKPVYLWITDEEIELRDAAHLWGKDTYETEDQLLAEVADKRAQVMCIGPAGENLVKYACIMNDKGSTAGRCGMGAVMGSKMLKAIVARGKKKVPIADPAAFKKVRSGMNETLKFNVVAAGLGAFGSNVHMEYGMAIGDTPVKNWREAYFKEGVENLSGTAVAETILTKNKSCYGCPVGCKRITEVKSGPFAALEGPGAEYEGAGALGTLQRLESVEANNKANELCNRLGMDCISAGSTIAYATEAYENGVLTDKETGGIKLGWNQPETLIQLLEKTATREGFGDILAEGSKAISERFGGKEYAIHVKGLECPMHDPRALWSMALTYGTSIRGACHCADSNLYADMGLVNHKDIGIKMTLPFRAKGKAAQTVGSQTKAVIANSAVLCEYVEVMTGGLPDLMEKINVVTGFGYNLDEMIKVGERIWYLKRALGNLCGATREDDQMPRRLLEPHPEGVTSNLTMMLFPTMMGMGPLSKIRNEKVMNMLSMIMEKFLYPNLNMVMRVTRLLPLFWLPQRGLAQGKESAVKRATVPYDVMLNEYYELRDIDEKGRPSRQRLESVGLRDVADALF